MVPSRSVADDAFALTTAALAASDGWRVVGYDVLVAEPFITLYKTPDHVAVPENAKACLTPAAVVIALHTSSDSISHVPTDK